MIAPLNLEEMPPAYEPCVMVDGRCTTWCHKFRVDHQELTTPTKETQPA